MRLVIIRWMHGLEFFLALFIASLEVTKRHLAGAVQHWWSHVSLRLLSRDSSQGWASAHSKRHLHANWACFAGRSSEWLISPSGSLGVSKSGNQPVEVSSKFHHSFLFNCPSCTWVWWRIRSDGNLRTDRSILRTDARQYLGQGSYSLMNCFPGCLWVALYFLGILCFLLWSK